MKIVTYFLFFLFHCCHSFFLQQQRTMSPPKYTRAGRLFLDRLTSTCPALCTSAVTMVSSGIARAGPDPNGSYMIKLLPNREILSIKIKNNKSLHHVRSIVHLHVHLHLLKTDNKMCIIKEKINSFLEIKNKKK